MQEWLFHDRRVGGQALAEALTDYQSDDSVVYALPRGGVETGAEVAQALNAPLDLVIARKIAHHDDPEYAIGAVTENGPPVLNYAETRRMAPFRLQEAEYHARVEAQRRRDTYFKNHRAIPALGKIAILVDDGIATGLTMRAAAEEIKRHRPTLLIAAAPVASEEAVWKLSKHVDHVVTVVPDKEFLGSVGEHYDEFPQLSDDDVLTLLRSVSHKH